MALPLVMEGTGQELKHTLEQFPESRFRLELLPASSVENELSGNTTREPGSLYDLLGDYVGCVEGNGRNNAAKASELFSEYVAKKHSEGHL